MTDKVVNTLLKIHMMQDDEQELTAQETAKAAGFPDTDLTELMEDLHDEGYLTRRRPIGHKEYVYRLSDAGIVLAVSQFSNYRSEWKFPAV